MKPYTARLSLLISGLCLLIVFLVILPKMIDSSNQKFVESEQKSAATATTQASVYRSDVADKGASQKIHWREQLAAIYMNGKLFGPHGEERMREIQGLVAGIQPADIPTAVNELQHLQLKAPTECGSDLLLRLLQKWGQSDIGSAADWVLTMPNGRDRQEAIVKVAREWEGQDFAKAELWASKLPNDVEKNDALESVANAATYTQPAASLGLANQLPESANRSDIIARAIECLASTSPDSALSYAQGIRNENLRQRAISSVVIGLAATDPVAAGTLALKSLQPGPIQDRAIIAVVQNWSRTDPLAATTWVDQFPDGNLRQVARDTINSASQRGGG